MSSPLPIAEISLLQGLPATSVSEFHELLHEEEFKPGEFLLRVSEKVGRIYIVRKGLVRVCLENEATPPNGRASADKSACAGLILAIEGPGAILGEISLLQNVNHTANVIALLPTKCAWLTGSDFEKFVRSHPAAAWNLAKCVASRVRRHTDHAETVSSRDAVVAIAKVLLPLAEEYGEPYKNASYLLPVTFTQEEWAIMTKFSRRTIVKALKHLKDRLIIHEISGHRLVVTDLECLREAGRGIRLDRR